MKHEWTSLGAVMRLSAETLPSAAIFQCSSYVDTSRTFLSAALLAVSE